MQLTTITLPLTAKITVTAEQFTEICQNNRDLRLEKTALGELIIMSPTGSDTGHRNIEIAYQLQAWNRKKKLGLAFDSSTGFKLPNGANRSPDVAWIKQERWDELTTEEKESFAPICPDFVLELRSKSDNLEKLREKMQEYISNGAKLGWLIDRKNQTVEIYKPEKPVQIMPSPTYLSGEDILPDFLLDLTNIL